MMFMQSIIRKQFFDPRHIFDATSWPKAAETSCVLSSITELLITKMSLIALICMMIDVLSEEANIYLQQYMPEWCVRVAEEDRDVLL